MQSEITKFVCVFGSAKPDMISVELERPPMLFEEDVSLNPSIEINFPG